MAVLHEIYDVFGWLHVDSLAAPHPSGEAGLLTRAARLPQDSVIRSFTRRTRRDDAENAETAGPGRELEAHTGVAVPLLYSRGSVALPDHRWASSSVECGERFRQDAHNEVPRVLFAGEFPIMQVTAC